MENKGFQFVSAESSLGHWREESSASMRRRPVWLWWQMLSFDAPTVAVVWSLLFARCAEVLLPAREIAALGATVWLIYSADRMADGIFARPGERLQERHRFHTSHSLALGGVGILVIFVLGVLLFDGLHSPERQMVLWLLLIVVLYFVWIRLPFQKLQSPAAKQVVVGAVFSAGSALPVWTRCGVDGVWIVQGALLFALLCCMNGLAIEHWEREAESETREAEVKSVTQRHSLRCGAYALALATGSALVLGSGLTPHSYVPLFVAGGVAATILAAVHRFRRDASAEELHLLADAALVVPALLALLWTL